MLRKDVDINNVTPMMKQYLEIKSKNEDIILFFRLGDFYEMFFEDAITVSRELELTLTGKNAGLNEKIPMCGVPHHSATVYIEKLVENGHKVGICEQLEDAKDVKGIVKRGIIQIVSKGTITNNEFLNEKENNYIGNIIDLDHAYAISYADISTGEINTSIIKHDISKIVTEIVSLGIKEIVVNEKFDKRITSILTNNFKISVSIHNDSVSTNEYEYIYNELTDMRNILAIKHLLSYILETQKRDLKHLQKAIIKDNKTHLKMDIHTKRNLELTETLRLKQRNNSLIWLLDKTKTAMGSRMLKVMIENPLTSKEEISKRHDVVDKLLTEFILKGELNDLLDEVYDLERLSGKIAFGSANARDMLQLKASLKALPRIKEILSEINFYKTFDLINELYELLDKSIYENPPLGIKEGYIIKETFNEELDELKSLRKGGKDFVAKFELEERERTGIKALKVGYNRIFGYFIEVSKSSKDLVKDEYGYERKQTLSNCERYISPVLKEKESLILNAEEKIVNLEYELFIMIRDKVKSYIPKLQEIAKVISEIDVLSSFATVTENNNYVRPLLTENKIINIKDGRHPVVEKVIDKAYVPNDIIMDEKTDIHLITGPNMAGKSTFMRQLAITVIMNQIGCFVPAKEATIKVFDAIYTRIGASDDLVSGESTFMVEMNEANYAISNATENSLVLFDELGRGTATFDGMALAQSIIEYIHDKIKAKTLFSTHYHELTDLEKTLKNLQNIHVSAYEEDGKITFLHKIKEGSVDKSYGIHVANLAGLPKELLKRANSILKVYENNEKRRDIKVQESLPIDELINEESATIKKLKEIDPLEITPMDALNIIYELKKDIK
jgi:DNA mismatch repair protein MutS